MNMQAISTAESRAKIWSVKHISPSSHTHSHPMVLADVGCNVVLDFFLLRPCSVT